MIALRFQEGAGDARPLLGISGQQFSAVGEKIRLATRILVRGSRSFRPGSRRRLGMAETIADRFRVMAEEVHVARFGFNEGGG